jgi:hypothetical protein
MKTLGFALICFTTLAQAAVPTCDAHWQRDVQARLGGDGHGPDLGSAEWQGAVEHQLGLRDAPERTGAAWCQRVQQALDEASRAPTCLTRQVRSDLEQRCASVPAWRGWMHALPRPMPPRNAAP